MSATSELHWKWRPIATAPKDGREILTYAHEVIRTAKLDPKLGKYRVNAYAYLPIDPTHWMPLPEPPGPA